jgi:signal transduction histidine kinase
MTEKPSLLLVDDEDGIRRVLGLTLADRGYDVRAAANAEEALALFRAAPAPVVVTDIKMPGMDGLELLRALKALDPECEVVLITGHGDIDLAIQGIKLDAADFVTKPIRDDALDIALARARERRAMRQAIREHTEHLERLVAQKTQELLAAERLAAVGQTVASLSHSIKNMASGLEGSLFLLRQGLDGDREAYLEQGFEMLEANVQKLKSLSLDMLRFAKPEELKPAPADPAEPARQVVALLAPRAATEGLDLRLEAPEGLPTALLDAEALHRCLLNLAGNALDACRAAGFGPEKPGGRVTIRVESLPGGGVRYSVADNGCGIAEAAQGKLFSAFYTTKGEGGSGLGLLTTKKTVEAHGGSLRISSAEHLGSTFDIIIPVAYENKVP